MPNKSKLPEDNDLDALFNAGLRARRDLYGLEQRKEGGNKPRIEDGDIKPEDYTAD